MKVLCDTVIRSVVRRFIKMDYANITTPCLVWHYVKVNHFSRNKINFFSVKICATVVWYTSAFSIGYVIVFTCILQTWRVVKQFIAQRYVNISSPAEDNYLILCTTLANFNRNLFREEEEKKNFINEHNWVV